MSVRALFFDVDTQHDFLDADGKLPVPGARRILANLRRLTEFAVEHRIPIVASADAHPRGDQEFDEFGEHCVPGSPGQKKLDETTARGREVVDPERLDQQIERLARGETPQLVIEKQTLDVFDKPMTEQILAALKPERVYVYGVTTDYCVLRTVLGLRRCNYAVTVLSDAIKPVEENAGRAALAHMRTAGAAMADTQTALKALARS
jgi:nicotinamidase/pyrazinamidase